MAKYNLGIQIISNGDIWPTISDNPMLRSQLLDWLSANSIDPNEIPIESPVTIEPGDSGHRIRYTAMLRNANGRKYLIDPDNPDKGVAAEERTVPLVVPLPDAWPQPVKPVEPDTELAEPTP